MSFANQLIRVVRPIVAKSKHFPPDLYATWNYVSGEDRVCHQRTTALLAHAAWMLPTAPAVEQENCYVIGSRPDPDRPGKQKAIKWQPDMVLKSATGTPLLFVDFESPNSSDFRVIDRDVALWYVNWIASGHPASEYLIITSLPDAKAPTWRSRYGQADGFDLVKARENPFRYWYSIFRRRFKATWKRYPITFANFDGNTLKPVSLDSI